MTDALARWQDFYAAVANAGAALVGLVYVGVSIHLGRHRIAAHIRVLGGMTTQNLIHPLFAALTMLLPVAPVVQGGLLLFLAVTGLANTIGTIYVEARRPQRADGATPMGRRDPGASRPVRALEAWALAPSGDDTALMTAYRYMMPLAASTILAVGAVGLIVGSPLAVYAPAIFVVLMFGVGIENAWVLLVGSPDDNPSMPNPRASTQHQVGAGPGEGSGRTPETGTRP